MDVFSVEGLLLFPPRAALPKGKKPNSKKYQRLSTWGVPRAENHGLTYAQKYDIRYSLPGMLNDPRLTPAPSCGNEQPVLPSLGEHEGWRILRSACGRLTETGEQRSASVVESDSHELPANGTMRKALSEVLPGICEELARLTEHVTPLIHSTQTAAWKEFRESFGPLFVEYEAILRRGAEVRQSISGLRSTPDDMAAQSVWVYYRLRGGRKDEVPLLEALINDKIIDDHYQRVCMDALAQLIPRKLAEHFEGRFPEIREVLQTLRSNEDPTVRDAAAQIETAASLGTLRMPRMLEDLTIADRMVVSACMSLRVVQDLFSDRSIKYLLMQLGVESEVTRLDPSVPHVCAAVPNAGDVLTMESPYVRKLLEYLPTGAERALEPLIAERKFSEAVMLNLSRFDRVVACARGFVEQRSLIKGHEFYIESVIAKLAIECALCLRGEFDQQNLSLLTHEVEHLPADSAIFRGGIVPFGRLKAAHDSAGDSYNLCLKAPVILTTLAKLEVGGDLCDLYKVLREDLELVDCPPPGVQHTALSYEQLFDLIHERLGYFLDGAADIDDLWNHGVITADGRRGDRADRRLRNVEAFKETLQYRLAFADSTPKDSSIGRVALATMALFPSQALEVYRGLPPFEGSARDRFDRDRFILSLTAEAFFAKISVKELQFKTATSKVSPWTELVSQVAKGGWPLPGQPALTFGYFGGCRNPLRSLGYSPEDSDRLRDIIAIWEPQDQARLNIYYRLARWGCFTARHELNPSIDSLFTVLTLLFDREDGNWWFHQFSDVMEHVTPSYGDASRKLVEAGRIFIELVALNAHDEKMTPLLASEVINYRHSLPGGLDEDPVIQKVISGTCPPDYVAQRRAALSRKLCHGEFNPATCDGLDVLLLARLFEVRRFAIPRPIAHVLSYAERGVAFPQFTPQTISLRAYKRDRDARRRNSAPDRNGPMYEEFEKRVAELAPLDSRIDADPNASLRYQFLWELIKNPYYSGPLSAAIRDTERKSTRSERAQVALFEQFEEALQEYRNNPRFAPVIEELRESLGVNIAVQEMRRRYEMKKSRPWGSRLSLKIHTSRGLEMELAGATSATCVRLMENIARNHPDGLFSTFWMEPESEAPQKAGGAFVFFGTLQANSDTPGERVMVIRGFNPRYELLVDVDVGDLINQYARYVYTRGKLLGINKVVMPYSSFWHSPATARPSVHFHLEETAYKQELLELGECAVKHFNDFTTDKVVVLWSDEHERREVKRSSRFFTWIKALVSGQRR